MSRVLFSSSALLSQLQLHKGAERVTLDVKGLHCELWSCQGKTTLACEARALVSSTRNTDRLIQVLESLADQPITLDLHHATGLANILYAYDRQGNPKDFTI